MKILLILLVATLFASCTKPQGPEAVLNDYVSKLFEGKMTREEVLTYFDGALHDQIKESTQEEFEKIIDMKNHSKKNMKIILKSCEDLKCYITYILKYDQTTTDDKYQIDVKKIVELHEIEGKWKITGVDNTKTFIEGKNPIKVDTQETTPPQEAPTESSNQEGLE